jgi:L-alanine-DL-glutamate epimerase-like enolase superfamily enzyme
MSTTLPRITGLRTIGLKRARPTVTASTTDTLIEVQTDVGLVAVAAPTPPRPWLRRPWRCCGAPSAIAIEPECGPSTHQRTLTGRGGSVTHAISGVDIALWDLLGQFTGQPISRLLGGRYRETIKPYARSSSPSPAVAGAPPRGALAGLPGLQARLGPIRARQRCRRRAAGEGGPRRRRGRVRVDGGRRRVGAVLAPRAEVGAAGRGHAGQLRRGVVRGGTAAG